VAAVPVGTPPLSDGRVSAAPSDDDRYARIDARYAEIARGYEACGLHVHIGVADRDAAVGVVGMLNPWLPTLLALSVNSPFRHGRDTGYGSWRIVEQSRFPGSGLAPTVADHRAWAAEVGRLVDCGALVDQTQTFWFARPSPHLPTVELRVADTAAVVDDAIAQALLARALVRTALARLETGQTPPSPPSALAEAAVWSAARYGCDGPAVDLATGTCTTGSRLVRALLDHTRDALADCGDLDEVETLVGGNRRTGAQRQRDAATRFGIAGMTRHLALLPQRDDQREGGHHVRCD
jgi:carboxylate-amine ligase